MAGTLLFCAPNHLEDIIYTPYIGGGDWPLAQGLPNLYSEFFIDEAISSNDSVASTKFELDLQIIQTVGFIGIPNSNLSTDAQLRVRGTSTQKWTGITVHTSAAAEDTVVSVAAATTTTVISAGDLLTFGDSEVLYRATASSTITGASFGNIYIQRDNDTVSAAGLDESIAGGGVVTCRTGDYTAAEIDTGWIDYYPPDIAVGAPYWGDAGLWDGRTTAEILLRRGLPKQRVIILPATKRVRFMKVEFDDEDNTDGYLAISALYVSPVTRPLYNMLYGAQFGLISATTKETSAGGVDVFQKEKTRRQVSFSLTNISLTELFSTYLDLDVSLDISGNMYFVYDSADTVLLNTRSFPGRFESLAPAIHSLYDSGDKNYVVTERLG
jgi:hypothetical protein